MVDIPKDVLTAAAVEILGGDITTFTIERLYHLITVTQHTTDLLLNEIERRGELTITNGVPELPYESEYMVETVLTRPNIRQ